MITADRLSKRYGAVTAVDDVTFRVEPGRVTGFLGPNGSGKSTVMRMLCGLSRPTSGCATVLGVPYTELLDPARRVGVLLDASAQHPGRTGRETLTLSAIVAGVDQRRVDEVIDVVGLTPREARRTVGGYSLGMRQRLGIANALLGDPEVLVLDEPVNGLDPAGIRWMRTMLRQLADDGGTVLLSSHLLLELEAVADDLLVIGGGRLVAHGPKDELLAAPGTTVTSADDAVLAQALRAEGHTVETARGGGLATSASAATVGLVALAARVALVGLAPARGGGLESLFFDLTSGHGREEVAA